MGLWVDECSLELLEGVRPEFTGSFNDYVCLTNWLLSGEGLHRERLVVIVEMYRETQNLCLCH